MFEYIDDFNINNIISLVAQFYLVFFENHKVWLARFIYFFPSAITQSLMQDPVSRNSMTSQS